jgi:hypothetical protein
MEKSTVYDATTSVQEGESSSIGEIHDIVQPTRWHKLRRYFTTREGWLGDYVSIYAPSDVCD